MIAAGIGFLVAFALIFLGVPIALALFFVGFFGIWGLVGMAPAMSMLPISAEDSTMSYTLSVVPLFVLMGNFIAGSGVSGDLFRAAQAAVGRRRGGLAMATVLSSGAFSAVCGSSIATAATIGKVALPQMKRFGYSDALASASVAAGGTLGVLIPPSVIMIIYGVMTETHIGKLFAAGIVPGLVAIVGYLFAVNLSIRMDPKAAPPATIKGAVDEEPRGSVWPIGLLFIVVLGGIYGGIFTATEAAGIGAMGGLLIALWRRALSWKRLGDILIDTVETSAVLFALMIGATLFSEFMNFTGVHETLLLIVRDAGLAPWAVIATILVIYLLLGCVLESISMILLTVPVFFPVVIGLGFDPVWFGILVVMTVELGLITPPVGMNLFIIKAVAPNVQLSSVIRGIVPFVGIDIIRLILIALFPILTLWLPNILFN